MEDMAAIWLFSSKPWDPLRGYPKNSWWTFVSPVFEKVFDPSPYGDIKLR